MMSKSYDHQTGTVRVTFSFPSAIWANQVALVGDFNQWDPAATPLRLHGPAWSTTLELEAGRSFRYRYLVDGRWYNDWNADGYVPNEKGGDDSVVVTGGTGGIPQLPYEISAPWSQASARL
ncbi:MAG: glycoside hydrolase [Chloroflexaceae bacterium]|nr:glycoside hydrolase [Chloroflexaceae bacterium]